MTQKFTIAGILIFIFTSGMHAQTEAETAKKMREAAEAAAKKAAELKKDSNKVWAVNGSFSITANSIMLQNWQAGGANVLSGTSILNVTPIYEKERSSWVTNLVLAYGLNRQEGVVFKMDDRIDFQTNYNYKFAKRWNYSALASFRTQFAEGFDSPNPETRQRISDFMSPGYAVYGLGITFKEKQKLIVYISPFTIKQTFVRDPVFNARGDYGVRDGKNMLTEGGGYINIIYREKLNEKINFQTRLDLFSNYEEKPQNMDVNAEVLFFWKITKFLSFNAALNLIYDENINVPVERPDGSLGSGPRLQLKSVMGAGFAYTF
ncbi:MAG: DUF3078 domain-containing protein [Cryomorphaceae bacterium]|nr:DUF3078 domain-containing protein [Cryomorphaceae bacterium]